MINIIAVIGKNQEIGKNNKLLWRIPEDMARFKKITTGHTVIMGRKTYESIGHPLPNRKNIIITRDKNFQAPGCRAVNSIAEAINSAQANAGSEIFIIGGGQIYEQAIPLADKLYLTIVDGAPPADTFFPNYDNFKLISEEISESQGLKYKFTIYEK